MSPYKVRVNAVSPGIVMSPHRVLARGGVGERIAQSYNMDSAEEALARYARENTLIGRFPEPEEVANVVVFLASERAGVLTGSFLIVDGGTVRLVL